LNEKVLFDNNSNGYKCLEKLLRKNLLYPSFFRVSKAKKIRIDIFHCHTSLKTYGNGDQKNRSDRQSFKVSCTDGIS